MKLALFIFSSIPFFSLGQLYKQENTNRFSSGSHSIETIYEDEIIFRSGGIHTSVLRKDSTGVWTRAYNLASPDLGITATVGWGDQFRAKGTTLVVPVRYTDKVGAGVLVYERKIGIWELAQFINAGYKHYTSFNFDGRNIAIVRSTAVLLYQKDSTGKWEQTSRINVSDNILKVGLMNDYVILRTRNQDDLPVIKVFKKDSSQWMETESKMDIDSSGHFAGNMVCNAGQVFAATYSVDYPVYQNTKVYTLTKNGKLIFKQKIVHPTNDKTPFFGTGLDCDGVTLVIGSPNTTGVRAGELMVYKQNTQNYWELVEVLKTNRSRVGNSVSVSGNMIVGGSNSAEGVIYESCGSITYAKEHVCKKFPANYSLELDSNFNSLNSMYTIALSNINGCDSISKTYIETAAPKIQVKQHNDTLVADTGFVNYKWVNCTNDSVVSTNTGRFYPVNGLDSFRAEAEFGNCVVVSSCTKQIATNISHTIKPISIWPNPAKSELFLSGIRDQDQAFVLNVNGHLVHNAKLRNGQSQMLLPDLPNGIYLFKINCVDGTSYSQKLLIAN